jgi:hypothetical protein
MSTYDELASIQGLRKFEHYEHDWPELESSLRLRLPSGYKKYVELFPPGTCRGSFSVYHPMDDWRGSLAETMTRTGEQFQDSADLRSFRIQAAKMRKGLAERPEPEFPFDFYPEDGGLVPWAMWEIDLILCWDSTGSDPDAWPVLLVNDRLDYDTLSGSTMECLIEVVGGRIVSSVIPNDFWRSGPELIRRRP